MFTAQANFNRRAEQWARARGKPIVGNGDVHRLRQLGTTYSLVDAEPDADAICAAILAGKVEVVARPLSWIDAGGLMIDLLGGSMFSPRWYRGHLSDPVRPTPASHPHRMHRDRRRRHDEAARP